MSDQLVHDERISAWFEAPEQLGFRPDRTDHYGPLPVLSAELLRLVLTDADDPRRRFRRPSTIGIVTVPLNHLVAPHLCLGDKVGLSRSVLVGGRLRQSGVPGRDECPTLRLPARDHRV